VKMVAEVLASPSDDISCPDGMGEHEPECDLAGKGMWFENIERPCCHKVHAGRAKHVKGKAHPEGDDMPGFQQTGEPF